MSKNDQEKSLGKSGGNMPKEISLGPSTSVDLSWLPESERKVLLTDYAKGMMDIRKKSYELGVDSDALKKTLDDLSYNACDVSDRGISVTITHSQTTKVGRTEVVMGNTERAQSGKLTKSQTGEKDWTPYYIFGGILALIIIASLLR